MITRFWCFNYRFLSIHILHVWILCITWWLPDSRYRGTSVQLFLSYFVIFQCFYFILKYAKNYRRKILQWLVILMLGVDIVKSKSNNDILLYFWNIAKLWTFVKLFYELFGRLLCLNFTLSYTALDCIIFYLIKAR